MTGLHYLQELCSAFGLKEAVAIKRVLRLMKKHGWGFTHVASLLLAKRHRTWSNAYTAVYNLRTPPWEKVHI